jgi:predicted PurR-regulated permease PerM
LLVSSNEEELHPIISLVAIIGAIIVYGIPGLLLGPILTQVAFRIIPLLMPKTKLEAAQTK